MSARIAANPQNVIEPLAISPHDPLAAAHEAVATWVEAVASIPEHRYYQTLDLKTLPSGQKLLESTAAEAVQYVHAAVLQVGHWDRQTEIVRAQAENELQRMNAHHLPGWESVWGRRQQAEAVVSSVIRRAATAEAGLAGDLELVRQLARQHFGIFRPSARLRVRSNATPRKRRWTRNCCRPLSDSASNCAPRMTKRPNAWARRCFSFAREPSPTRSSTTCRSRRSFPPFTTPAAAGCDEVLDQLKRHLGLARKQELPATTLLDPDRFALRDDSPLRQEHQTLSRFFNEVVGTPHYHGPDLRDFPAGRELLGNARGQLRTCPACCGRRAARARVAFARGRLYRDRGLAISGYRGGSGRAAVRVGVCHLA